MLSFKIFKYTFFYRTPPMAASEIKKVFNFQHFLLWLAFYIKHAVLGIIQISFSSNRFKRKHWPVKFVIHATEIHQTEIRLKILIFIWSKQKMWIYIYRFYKSICQQNVLLVQLKFPKWRSTLKDQQFQSCKN